MTGAHPEHFGSAPERRHLGTATAPASVTRTIPVTDPSVRMQLLSRIVAAFDEPDQRALNTLMGSGLTAEIVDKLRRMPLVDALRFTAQNCGLSIELDMRLLKQHLDAVDRARADHKLYEAFVRAGASPQLVSRLFAVSQIDVRRYRAILAPETRAGGRPKAPPDDVRVEILRAWDEVQATAESERQKFYRMHQLFPDVPLAAIESVLASAERPALVERRP